MKVTCPPLQFRHSYRLEPVELTSLVMLNKMGSLGWGCCEELPYLGLGWAGT
jgi:hypothetical protein